MTDAGTGPSLRILHVLRAPVGGLFRHVADLARGQAVRGHQVGLIADATTGGARGEALLADLKAGLALGLTRVAMSRHIGIGDAAAVALVARCAVESQADVLHGHGAKGGAYARLARARHPIRVYTPHGGSLHYRWSSPTGLLYLTLERLLMPRTDLFLFESAYGRAAFTAKIGRPEPNCVVHNGVSAAEFEPVVADPAATDLLFVGELRLLKGVDVLIDAIATLAKSGQPVTATIVGDGPDRAIFEAAVTASGLGGLVKFTGALPAREAFTLGRLLVVPSRAESLPYIVLEAAAAGLPMIATKVGGIPEIFGADAGELVAPDDATVLAHAIQSALHNPAEQRQAAERLRTHVREAFSTETMTDAVVAAYRRALTSKHG
ncbi:MAG: glycosyltransferase family 4 protein [Pseudolabrys sp.]